MKIYEIVESVESGNVEKHLHNTIRKLSFSLKYFDHYIVTTSYSDAIEELILHSTPLDPIIVLLSQNNRATAKLVTKYENLRQQALQKIQSGI